MSINQSGSNELHLLDAAPTDWLKDAFAATCDDHLFHPRKSAIVTTRHPRSTLNV